MDNRAGEMEVFVEVARRRSFSAAGRKLGLSPSAVSKLVTRLEDRLGARLLSRSTRAVQTTAEGEAYLERASAILADIADAERLIASGAGATPRGRLRVSASVGFGVRCVVPLVPAFLERYPEVELDLSLTDGIIDLAEERADVALRSGPMRDSTLKARKIIESRRVVVASPDYIARHGMPERPDDLDHHNCLKFNFRRSVDEWPFRDRETGETVLKSVSGNLYVNNGATLRALCLDGLGIGRIGQFHVEAEIASGRLVPLLDDWNPEDLEVIHAVYAGHDHLAARIRAFIDFLVDRNTQTPRPGAAALSV